MLKLLAKGLFGRLLSYAAFTLGFWLLYQGLSRPNIGLGIVGGAVVLLGTYLMVQARKSDPSYLPIFDENQAGDAPSPEANPATTEDTEKL